LIKLRIDVDYPYPSRIRSFIYVALGIRTSGSYLRNSKIIAKMITESDENVKAYWFLTPKTVPDKKLLALLDSSKHEIGLHIVNDPKKELRRLEEVTGKKVNYYTIHGTSHLFARMMWKRWKTKAPKIPDDFPLQSFHQFPTYGLDSLCYMHDMEQAIEMARGYIEEGDVLYFHPIWLFQRGRINHRGPFYEALRRILDLDESFEMLAFRKKFFFKLANDAKEYERDVFPTEEFTEKLRERGVDVFTFIERKWCTSIPKPSKFWSRANDNIALLQVADYDEWWKNIGKKTRNMVRKAEKSGVRVEIVEPNEELAEGIWRIYNEIPFRQERAFPHYGVPLQTVNRDVLSSKNSTYIGAYFEEELIGFIQLVHGDNVTLISQILSMQKHWDKAVNNAMIAKAVEVCANRGIRWLMYGRMGNHPTLDSFKLNNGFTQFLLTRYYIPLTEKGKIATKLGLHREMKDALPMSMKYALIPVYNWISRSKMKIRLWLKPKTAI
jgi:signal peptidase I